MQRGEPGDGLDMEPTKTNLLKGESAAMIERVLTIKDGEILYIYIYIYVYTYKHTHIYII